MAFYAVGFLVILVTVLLMVALTKPKIYLSGQKKMLFVLGLVFSFAVLYVVL